MSALQGREKAAPKALRLYSLHRAGERAKGAILSRERMGDSSFILDIAYSVRDGRVYEGRGEFTNTLFDVLYTIEYGGY